MSMEANQPVGSGEVSQEHRQYAAITQGLILAMGALGLINGLLGLLPLGLGLIGLSGLLGTLGWLAMIGVVVVFFLWKDKGDFLYGHVRQALGLVLLSFAVAIVLGILSSFVGVAAIVTGRLPTILVVTGLIGMAINAVFAYFGYNGLQAAQKGEPYLYPVVGEFIANFGKK